MALQAEMPRQILSIAAIFWNVSDPRRNCLLPKRRAELVKAILPQPARLHRGQYVSHRARVEIESLQSRMTGGQRWNVRVTTPTNRNQHQPTSRLRNAKVRSIDDAVPHPVPHSP